MAQAARRDARMSVAGFQAWSEQRPGDERWELLDGEPLLMAPPSARHQRIVTNLVKGLDGLAERRGCSAYPGLAIVGEAFDDYAPYPDLVVHCGNAPSDGHVSDPLLVAEVLSQSTIINDRGRKSAFCRAVPSLQVLVLVYHNEARVEVWRRADGWEMHVLDARDVMHLPELDGTISVADIYARVVF